MNHTSLVTGRSMFPRIYCVALYMFEKDEEVLPSGDNYPAGNKLLTINF